MREDREIMLEIKLRKKRIEKKPEKITMDHDLFGRIDEELLA